MATYGYGIRAIHPATVGPHVLGFSGLRTSDDIFQIWRGSSSTYLVHRITWQGDIVPYDGTTELALSATGPFVYITGGNGPPSGTPDEAANGYSPLFIDRLNGRLYIYHSAGWHYATLT